MCGIAGMFDRSAKQPVREANLRQMLAMLRHRGPDEFGILLDREVGLGNARLSIIDLGGGSSRSPTRTNRSGSSSTARFSTTSNCARNWRPAGIASAPPRTRKSSCTCSRNMARLPRQDERPVRHRHLGHPRRRLFLARDRVGVRPLFYTQTSEGTLLFASEIKAILSDPARHGRKSIRRRSSKSSRSGGR